MFDKIAAVKMSLEVRIGEVTKKTNLELLEADELQKIMLIHNVFEVFDVNKDLQEITETYLKIGKAYKSFFHKVDPIEAPSEKLMPLKLTDDENPSELAQQLQSKLAEQQPIIENKYSKGRLAEAYNEALSSPSEAEQPEHYKTGIKVENGISKYKARLHCDCGTQVNRYIPKNNRNVTCRECGKEHSIRWAKKGYLERDRNGNFFIAGTFVGDDEKE